MPLPVYLACLAHVWPGFNTNDSTWQRAQFAGGQYSKHHSLLDTYVFQGLLGRNDLGTTNLIQSIVLASCIIATLALLTRHLSRRWIAALTLAYALYPLFPLYATIRTKDTVAAGFTLLLAVALYELIASSGSGGRIGESSGRGGGGGRIGGRGCRGNHNPADGTVGPDAAGTADGTYTTSPTAGTSCFEHSAGSPAEATAGSSTGTRQRLRAHASRITSPLLNSPWFIAAVAVLLFICNEYRKNNILFVLAVLVFLAIRYRAQWKRVVALIAAFAMLTAAWGSFEDYGLKAEPSETTEMLGVPLQQIGYIYHENQNGNPQNLPESADRYFTSFRSADDWAKNYQPLIADQEKLFELSNDDLPEFLSNWASLCFSNFGSCVNAYWQFEGSLVNPLMVANDQYLYASGITHTAPEVLAESPMGLVPHYLLNVALLDWWLVALAIMAVRRGRAQLLSLFLIPVGIVLSIMVAALNVELRVLLAVFLCAPMLTAVCLGDQDAGRLGDPSCRDEPTVRDSAREQESFDEGHDLSKAD
ncbi:hypothetical protein BW12_01465 [Bifidobacterium sp. UTCIF-3]|nr:hypothetical protein BW09_06880 [Bifidobacterium sp. UTCIF-1]TPF80206.1 hypothetical protein BW08_06100 [Bifidobacterium sp. UTCIF-24]TPF83012.1 hypothetical protein BW12_01465 [Bifidobacterium sp. UTCIF-3]TPF83919.1 hypothetical protein BW07_07850 [Bifidobacterium sp. UTCIF-36]TPF90611.1 hypothetical protein BW10_02715 [Bifidobacterium sp. UTBIF-56]